MGCVGEYILTLSLLIATEKKTSFVSKQTVQERVRLKRKLHAYTLTPSPHNSYTLAPMVIYTSPTWLYTRPK